MISKFGHRWVVPWKSEEQVREELKDAPDVGCIGNLCSGALYIKCKAEWKEPRDEKIIRREIVRAAKRHLAREKKLAAAPKPGNRPRPSAPREPAAATRHASTSTPRKRYGSSPSGTALPPARPRGRPSTVSPPGWKPGSPRSPPAKPSDGTRGTRSSATSETPAKHENHRL